MNYTIDSSYAFQKVPAYPVSADQKETAKKLPEDQFFSEIQNPLLKDKQEIKEQTHEAVMMDFSEVKNFLFMLIGAEVQVKPENGTKSGLLLDRLA
jgi:hypothetical protein